jgi:hypothetical protein
MDTMNPGDPTRRYNPDRDVLPIIAVRRDGPYRLEGFMGTGFLVGKNVLVTCYHCVPENDERAYAVAFPRKYFSGYVPNDVPGTPYIVVRLRNIEQDRSGLDLATATVPFDADGLLLGTETMLGYGLDTFTFGYPLTSDVPDPTIGRRINFSPRYLRGYLTRGFDNDVPGHGLTPTIEFDMPAPQGLSGAPVVEVNTTHVIGVVYGTKDTGTIEEYSRVDEATGERIPELQRITTFAVAHNVVSLKNVRGAATNGLPLAEYLKV